MNYVDKTAIPCPQPAAAIEALLQVFGYMAANLDDGVWPASRESLLRLHSAAGRSLKSILRNPSGSQALSVSRALETTQDLPVHCPTEWERHHA